ncbi:hypothetical protein ACTFIR_010522 [Dictyostelium discoideum]
MFSKNINKVRFNLTLMDEGEYYFDDYSAIFYPPSNTEEESWQKRIAGRILVCSSSMFFEPDDSKLPIMKFPYKDMSSIGAWLNSLSSAPPAHLPTPQPIPQSILSPSKPPTPTPTPIVVEQPSPTRSAFSRLLSFSSLTSKVTTPTPTPTPTPPTPQPTSIAPTPTITTNPYTSFSVSPNPPSPLLSQLFEQAKPSFLASKGDIFYVKSSQVIEMKENSRNHPYIFKQYNNIDFKFSFNYVKQNIVLDVMKVFHNYSGKEKIQRDELIKQMVEDRENKIFFDITQLVDMNERNILELKCSKISPLVENPGRLLITNARLYFQPMNNIEENRLKNYSLQSIIRVLQRRHSLREIGLELFFDDGSSLFLKFNNTITRNQVYDLLVKHLCTNIMHINEQANYLLKWQNGIISNYDYLLYLNNLAGRTFNDLTQYPVFPWIIADYQSTTLDLNRNETFRDLSKPIGALNPTRLATFQDRYHQIPDDQPKFLYGTHYSTPAYVLYFLVRQVPEYMLRLQNGRFDSPNRMFYSIEETWNSVLNSTTDVKELIPEFYKPSFESSISSSRNGGGGGDDDDNFENGIFLTNSENLPLGIRQDNNVINDIILPPWASSPKDFISKLHQALESEYVSQNLHHWIDLIFGYKQKGEEAVRANNLFYHLTYEGSIDIESITNPFEREGMEAQINEFGQTPRQIFKTPHPQRLPQQLRNQNLKIELSDLEQNINFIFDELNNCNINELNNDNDNNNNLNNNNNNNIDNNNNNNINNNINNIENINSLNNNENNENSYDKKNSSDNIKNSNGFENNDNNFNNFNNENENLNDENENLTFLGGEERNNSNNWGSLNFLKFNQNIKLHKDKISALYLSNNSETIYSVSLDSCLKIYSLKEKRQIRSLNLCNLALSSFQLSKDEKYIIIGSWDNNIYVYSVGNGSISYSIPGHSDAVSCLKLHNNNILVSGSWDSSVKVWRTHRQSNGAISIEKTPIADFVDSDTEIRSIDISSNGTMFCAGSSDGYLYFYDLLTLQLIRRISCFFDELVCIKFTPDGSRIITACIDGSVKLIGIEGSEIFSFKVKGEIHCLDSDGSSLIIGTDRGLCLWSLTTGTEIKDSVSPFLSQSSNESIHSLNVSINQSSNKPILLTGTEAGSISIWQQ